MNIKTDFLNEKRKLAVVGLGYVGLPIAIAFSKRLETIGFDISTRKIEQYRRGIDPMNQVGDDEISHTTTQFTNNEKHLAMADFIIVAVPTPVKTDKTPDLTPVTGACEIVGKNMKKGCIVIFESTVYPGVTEEICIPILENQSGLICGKDFSVGYSPERINPGDTVHQLENIVKIVSGFDAKTTEIIADLYELIIEADVFKVSSIKVAEAAKLVENSQRDINIAFMNELAMVFEKMNISTQEVMNAMNTKWNALGFTPGLVGGHCIGVDPYYFIYKAENLGYHSQIILSGRKINDDMGAFIAEKAIKSLVKTGKIVKNSKIYIMGITFKENCPDIRNSKVEDIVKKLNEYEVDVEIVDPVADEMEVKETYHVDVKRLSEVNDADCIIFAVAHNEFKQLTIETIDRMFKKMDTKDKVIIDVKNIYYELKLEESGYHYWGL